AEDGIRDFHVTGVQTCALPISRPLDETELPLELPHVESYKPGPEGEGPLANIGSWTAQHLETNTMPGYAGSSWYFLRYMDPHNEIGRASCRAAARDSGAGGSRR